MRKVGLVAFTVTSLVLVPAAIHKLTAGSKQLARLVAPDARSLEIDGAKIDVAVDRAILDAGDQVKVKLHATSGKAHKVTVDVLVLESTGSDGGRVESPPNRIARERVTLDVKADGATKELAFRLPGTRGRGMEGIDTLGHYTILVMAPKAADQLERLRRRADKVDGMTDETGAYSAFMTAYYESPEDDADGVTEEVGKLGATARLTVQTRAKSSPVALRVPETVRPNEAFSVIVRVSNPFKHAVAGVGVRLEIPTMLHGDYLGLPAEQVDITGGEEISVDLKARETKQVEFRVTAKTVGVLGLYARTDCSSCDYQDWGLSDGVIDAIDVIETPTVVGRAL